MEIVRQAREPMEEDVLIIEILERFGEEIPNEMALLQIQQKIMEAIAECVGNGSLIVHWPGRPDCLGSRLLRCA